MRCSRRGGAPGSGEQRVNVEGSPWLVCSGVPGLGWGKSTPPFPAARPLATHGSTFSARAAPPTSPCTLLRAPSAVRRCVWREIPERRRGRGQQSRCACGPSCLVQPRPRARPPVCRGPGGAGLSREGLALAGSRAEPGLGAVGAAGLGAETCGDNEKSQNPLPRGGSFRVFPRWSPCVRRGGGGGRGTGWRLVLPARRRCGDGVAPGRTRFEVRENVESRKFPLLDLEVN